MIELFCKAVVNELGATGLLVLGLYLILYNPMRSIAHSLCVINFEVGEILRTLKENKPKE